MATDAIKLLKDDHDKVRDLFEQLMDTTERATKKRTKLIEQINKELKIHTTIEEEIFYPAFRDAIKEKDKKKMFHEALEEHHVVDLVHHRGVVRVMQEVAIEVREVGDQGSCLLRIAPNGSAERVERVE